jgi:hypothetical protein
MKTIWLLGALLLGACSSNDDSSSDTPGGGTDNTVIASTPLSGKVDGKPWTFVFGQTDSFLSDETKLWTALYAETFPACNGIPDNTQPEVLMQLPREPGSYKLSLNLNATFAIRRGDTDTDNLVATKGKLVIDSVSATEVKGGAFIEYDANNSVNGQFQATICPE